jgi:hypothetical protein
MIAPVAASVRIVIAVHRFHFLLLNFQSFLLAFLSVNMLNFLSHLFKNKNLLSG